VDSCESTSSAVKASVWFTKPESNSSTGSRCAGGAGREPSTRISAGCAPESEGLEGCPGETGVWAAWARWATPATGASSPAIRAHAVAFPCLNRIDSPAPQVLSKTAEGPRVPERPGASVTGQRMGALAASAGPQEPPATDPPAERIYFRADLTSRAS
jgi:hypothetical protein